MASYIADSVSATSTDVDAKIIMSLDMKVSLGGTNFSREQGALLQCSTIIGLDEATSSIDFATDAKIQTTIQEEFMQLLLLRGECNNHSDLSTMINYDCLIILDKGRIAEFDTPPHLLLSAKAKAERDGG
ncbi:hypothetical protein IW261DRAFT_1554560 [Armillaria novae-zelandiae]|uniref:Uncharacterized protein n=1 Tax=Armillaria novae-zelandiae TaxID=153914 RepID=A0AA39KFP5_9AGAR|nr:hypothetical protein IW261DRAFT_1554560 [Armillaria novae-zelandiae]